MTTRTRAATHAGSWYDDDEVKLDRKLSGWIS
jgi:predicted class III extradiol MEMO1 family dioxygenase